MDFKIHINLADFDAVIFDMDGTMVDNMTYHKKTWKEFAKRHGLDITDEEFKEKISGKKNDKIFQIIFKQEEVAKFTEEKESLYRELYAPFIKEVQGLRHIINELQQHHKKLAIATS